MSLKLNSSGNGSITLQEPVTASNRTLNLPDADGTLFLNSTNGALNVNSAAPANSVVVDATGNLGLGTTSPGAKLNVAGAAGTSVNTILANGTTTGANFWRLTNTGGDGVLGVESSTPGGIVSSSSAYATVLYTVGATSLQLGTNSSIKATLDSAGNLGLGVGTTSPTFVNGAGGLQVSRATSPAIRLNTPTASFEAVCDASASYLFATSNTPLVFGTNNTERARIDSSGNLLVGTTSALGIGITLSGGGTQIVNNFNADYTVASFRINGTQRGFITTTSSGTTYSTSSDYRLKHNIQPMTGALAKVALLKPCTYKWKADGSDGEGFIAHELAEVVPQCVTGEKDAVDADDNPVYQGIDTSFLVATLTAAIQEQQAIITAQASAIETLTARIEALEAK